jgi:hypothetical protein
MRSKLFLVVFVVLFSILLISSVDAAGSLNFTQNFSVNEVARANVTYILSTANSTSLYEFLIELIMGMGLFLLSLWASTKPEMNEIDGILSAMSTLPLFVAAFTATSVEVVTSFGTDALYYNNITEWVLRENHTVYHFDITGIVLWMFSVIATLNTIRIVINHRKFNQMFEKERES